MRQLAIVALGFWLAGAAAAHAQNSFAKYEPPGSRGFSAYKSPYAQPAAPSARETSPSVAHRYGVQPYMQPVSPKPIGPQTFKPFKGMSTYDGPGAFKPYKPPKMKSVYDH
jgi:hypothetical protein